MSKLIDMKKNKIIKKPPKEYHYRGNLKCPYFHIEKSSMKIEAGESYGFIVPIKVCTHPDIEDRTNCEGDTKKCLLDVA